MKTILVASGTSDNKRKAAVEFIQHYLTEKGLEVAVIGKSIYEVTTIEPEIDAVVSIGQLSIQPNVPVINGTPFITSFGRENCCDSLIEAL